MNQYRRFLELCVPFAVLVVGACAQGTSSDPSAPDGGRGPATADARTGPGAADGAVGTMSDAAVGTAQSITITDTNSDNIVVGNSVGCLVPDQNIHLDNSYFRAFNLAAHGINSQFNVSGVQIGIEVATAGLGGSQPADVRLHTLTGPLTMANLSQLNSVSTTLANMGSGMITVPISGVVPVGSQLVVEFHTPDGSTAQNVILIGSNTSGETSATYVRSTDCGIDEPAATGAPPIGVQMHWVVKVTGTHTP